MKVLVFRKARKARTRRTRPMPNAISCMRDVSPDFHQVADEPLDPAVTQLEYITEDQIQNRSVFALRAHRSFSDDHVILFGETRDGDRGTPCECFIFDVP